MTLTIDLSPEEEAQLKTVASIRGVEPEEHAHDLLANLLRSVPNQEAEDGEQQKAEQALMASARSGDLAARLKLMAMTPVIPMRDAATGEATPIMSREALSREYIYED